jgi:hypothetical protein
MFAAHTNVYTNRRLYSLGHEKDISLMSAGEYGHDFPKFWIPEGHVSLLPPLGNHLHSGWWPSVIEPLRMVTSSEFMPSC